MYAQGDRNPVRPPATPSGQATLGEPFGLACQALERVGMALVVVDSEGAFRCANRLAEKSFGNLLVWKDGSLKAATLSATLRLRQALAAATCPNAARATLIHLTGAGSGRAGAEPVPVLVAPAGPSSGEKRHAMMIFSTPEDPAELEAQLRQAYGLTPAEGRLLVAMINGTRPAEYATASGIGLSTIKTHMRRLLAKTGEKRQAGLVRRVLIEQRLRPDLQPDPQMTSRRLPPSAENARAAPA